MDVDEAKLDAIIEEMNAAFTPSPYMAVNVFWLAVVKMANLLPSPGEEHERIASLLRQLPRESAHFVVAAEGGIGVHREVEPGRLTKLVA